MDTAILMLIALVLGSGAAGGLLSAWGAVRRTLGLKTRLDALELDLEVFKRQLVAEIKRRSGAEGLAQTRRNKEIDDLARNMHTKINEQPAPNFGPAWWETEGKRG